MAAYTTSTSTLKGILANPALDLDHVEKTTEELAEVMACQEEVDSAIRIGGAVAVGASGVEEVDDEELKKELEAMVRDEKEAQAQAAQVAAAVKAAEREKEKVVIQEPAELPIPAKTAQSDQAETDTEAERVWRERHEEAQQRKKEERERAEVERMRRQDKMAAE
jgi:charged multivesicular body protein 7